MMSDSASQSLAERIYTRDHIKKLPKNRKLELIALKEINRRIKLWDIIRDMILDSMHLGEQIKTELEKKKKDRKNRNAKVEKTKSLQQKPESSNCDNLSEQVKNISAAQVVEQSTSKCGETDQPRKRKSGRRVENAIEIVIEKRVNKILDFLLRWKDDGSSNNEWELVGGRCNPTWIMKALKRRLKRQIKTLNDLK